MDENRDKNERELLEALEARLARMEKRERRSSVRNIIVLCALVLAIGILAAALIPKINAAEAMIAQVSEVMKGVDMQELTDTLNAVGEIDVKELEAAIGALGSLDMDGLQKELNSIGELAEKASVIDMEELNTAIENLNTALTPILKLFGGNG